MIDALLFAAAALGGLLAADLFTGLLHWFEDRYGNPDWPVLGKAAYVNQQHHVAPRACLSDPALRQTKEIALIGGLFFALFALLGWLNVFTVSFCAFTALSTQFHMAAHRKPADNPRWVRALQKTELMQSPQHHAHHHRGAKDTHFCVMTGWLNPALEKLHMFRALEWLIMATVKVRPRLDPTVNPKYRSS